MRSLDAPTKSGKIWTRRSVYERLTNIAYTGKTYVFTASDGKIFGKPKEDWIELSDITPAIISQELFESAQKQLKVNFEKSIRNCKREYMLRGHLRCAKCGHAFVGGAMNGKRRYRCLNTMKINAPIERCKSRTWDAEKLETLVWAQIVHYLSDRDLIASELRRQCEDASRLGDI